MQPSMFSILFMNILIKFDSGCILLKWMMISQNIPIIKHARFLADLNVSLPYLSS